MIQNTDEKSFSALAYECPDCTFEQHQAIETPEGREGILAVAGGLCLPTGGCSLLSITVYFWSVLAENERVVPTLT